MNIALDVDGVLADVMLSWIEKSNRHRARMTKKQITSWDFWRNLGISRNDFFMELSECWKDWKSIPPTEKNLSKSTKKLSGIGGVDIVTARERSTGGHVRQWLAFHGITFDRYVSVAEGTLKADLDYDVFIDDSPVNAAAFIQKKKSVLLYEQPWNADFRDRRAVRISSLEEALELIS